jgi:hypothetical protein
MMTSKERQALHERRIAAARAPAPPPQGIFDTLQVDEMPPDVMEVSEEAFSAIGTTLHFANAAFIRQGVDDSVRILALLTLLITPLVDIAQGAGVTEAEAMCRRATRIWA